MLYYVVLYYIIFKNYIHLFEKFVYSITWLLALGSTQPLTEMSFKNISWRERWLVRWIDMWQLSWILGASTSWNSQGLYRDCFTYYLTSHTAYKTVVDWLSSLLSGRTEDKQRCELGAEGGGGGTGREIRVQLSVYIPWRNTGRVEVLVHSFLTFA